MLRPQNCALPWSLPAALVAAATAVSLSMPTASYAQTDYYNTDRGRPIQIEDAYATERKAFELKLAPVRLQRTTGSAYSWSLQPEIAYGILPRTQIELSAPLSYRESGTEHRTGLTGLEFSVFHNFNVETATVPALALRADILAPIGNLATQHVYSTLTAIGTRTYRWARFHVNGQYTFGSAPTSRFSEPNAGVEFGDLDASRWLAGIAVDKTYPLQSTLVTAEFFGRKPITFANVTSPTEYTAGTGIRFQLNPTLALDGGIGRHLNGAEQGWYVTFGSAYAFSIKSLFPDN